ncbi:MAG: aldo/keto reductase [Clostridia bacterium]|nr:aldo/keto reductase [Clostridia bacterium]
MIYKDFLGKKLSALGMGCMRLPCSADGKIDEAATAEMVEYAINKGVNYFDTAWGYHDGESENVMGRVLSKYPRESFYLADKFPGYASANWGKAEEIFEQQLKKCKVEYFDFYMFHNLCDMNVDAYLDDAKYGDKTYLLKQKQNGRIKHLGFSAHGDLNIMRRFLEAYGDIMEFCQIQLNWLDWDFQNAKAKVALLNEYNVPVWVMEPLRGGKLVDINTDYVNRLNELRPEVSLPEWAFRFIQTVPEVKVTLSGMSNFKQIKENIETFSEEKPLTQQEWGALLAIGAEMTGKKTLPCTACRYCTTYCPMELDIPKLIELYNEHRYSDGGFIAPMALSALPEDKKPSACIGCKACEEVCPQLIKISEMMQDFVAHLG